MICPACGELVVARPEQEVLIIPAHPDRVMPFDQCSARVVTMSDRPA